jgi:MerR family redox-sensitive transcriptional activator SoxR
MTISELAAESGLPASTIPYWEKIGVLPKPVRAGGQRRYSADAVQRLAVLRLANRPRAAAAIYLEYGVSPSNGRP